VDSSLQVLYSHLPEVGNVRGTPPLKNAGDLLGIRVLDHIILTANGAFSFADAGLL
jgi:DNA repair protein RadC